MRRFLASAVALVIVSAPPLRAEALSASYLYNLSTTTGVVRSSWPSVVYEPRHDEVLVVTDGFVRVFNYIGMEIHSFGDEEETGIVKSVAVLDDDDMIVLALHKGRPVILRCNYRGEPISKFELTGVPAAFAQANPDLVLFKNGRLYFADRPSMKVVVTDAKGAFQTGYDLLDILKANRRDESRKKSTADDLTMSSLAVDDTGNLFITCPALFYVFVVSPNGKVDGFGTRGSNAGKFNVVGGVTTDPRGNIWVTDSLRAVVMVFDKTFEFLGEFGYRGNRRGNLVAPLDLAVGKDGKVFVGQAGDRGVAVFRVSM